MIAENGIEWKTRTTIDGGGRCVVHDDPSECEPPLRSHHVITQSALRRHGLYALRWETANAALVCEGAHRRHHSGHTRIPRERLPPAAIEFAERNGLGWMLDRFYPTITE